MTLVTKEDYWIGESQAVALLRLLEYRPDDGPGQSKSRARLRACYAPVIERLRKKEGSKADMRSLADLLRTLGRHGEADVVEATL